MRQLLVGLGGSQPTPLCLSYEKLLRIKLTLRDIFEPFVGSHDCGECAEKSRSQASACDLDISSTVKKVWRGTREREVEPQKISRARNCGSCRLYGGLLEAEIKIYSLSSIREQ
jgi:hypothetical protein